MIDEMNSMDDRNRVGVALLVLRITVFLVMLVWTIDKFVRPDHAASVYEHFYFLRGFGPGLIYVIGIAELVLLIGFLIGFAPWLTYGLVLLLHAVSTFSSFQRYLHPFQGPNILFFAAWPMLGACFALYYVRDLDTLFRLGSSSRSSWHHKTDADAAE
jgi:putative oxidoreductase